MIRQRIHKLQASLRARNLDAILITEPANRRYLSGYTPADHGIQESSGVLLIPKKGGPWLLTDSRFELQAKEEATGFTVELYRKGLFTLLKTLLPSLGVKRLTFESHYFLHSSVGRMEETLGKHVELVPLTGLLEGMRVIKSEEEICLLKQSVLLNELVFQQVRSMVAPGMTEIDLALAIDNTMRKLGAERPSFETIVAFGANAAKPHAVPSSRVLKENELVLIDMGLVLAGYCSDMTRTFFFGGEPDSLFLERLRIVRQAQLAAIKAIRAGAICREVDQAARQVITDAGYGSHFGHGLGHGVGLAVHEAPRLSPRNRKRLQAGMIVTIEPGLYFPDWGGIRLENMAVVREDGCELLNEDVSGLDL
jgi:Xaa-Pro aminopeptidase